MSLGWTNGGGLFVFPLPAHHTIEMITFSYGSFMLSLDISRYKTHNQNKAHCEVSKNNNKLYQIELWKYFKPR